MDEENKTLESEGIREESKDGEEEKIMIKIKSINKQIMKMKERMEILNRREKELKEELGNVTSEIDAVKEEKREIGMIEENKKKQMKEIVKMNSNKTPLFSIKSWTNCEKFEMIYDSDTMGFNQRTFQSTVYGRKNILGMVITKNNDIFGSFHTVPIKIISSDMNWTNDNDFFVYSIMKDGYQNYGCYQKKEGVYCKLRSIRMVFDDETFYRVNNAFYLRPYLYEKKGKTWDDFNKDYDDIDKNMSFTTTLGFTPIRVLVYQCF
ncbi:hypothetical protein EDI_252880 [Entamoeba dispar SAW760]|uniref:TLDc domain-containing protein n=1 Tax=Entamoeba dispar (strain ATCC PRA-260 / SAW760) TaxID=370354 RepID=B0EF93_ENTDS|nr:uncharacterized protein EDI_252880 [Entamoeba dispar SAW760]EDR26823.1 hypothetical protein EDI_252880 [Entamoeba dispar SAW760]|eukprot:EDR26823.1 hypothetical protein EDI_252880 [Entamoeba dispar SAW760]